MSSIEAKRTESSSMPDHGLKDLTVVNGNISVAFGPRRREVDRIAS